MSSKDIQRWPRSPQRWFSLANTAALSAAALITVIASLIGALNGCSPA
jgi:hypothetical protein